MAVTQKHIAQSLGVSHQLVSYALNGGGSISQERRREVLAAAQEMGYRRNELARAMVTGRSHILGLLTYNDSGEHIATVVSGALDEATRAGYAVKVLHISHQGSMDELRDVAHRCSAWQLDGALAVALKPDAIAVFAAELASIGCPVAYVENVDWPTSMLVKTDDHSAFRAAVEHLVALGHRHIVHLSGPNHPLTTARNAIFLEMLREFDLPVDVQSLIANHPVDWADRETIEAITHALLDRSPRPSAVICAGDASAMIVMRVAQQRGFQVPGDLSVIGFGNFGLAAHAYPPLTSIAQPFREMGRLTAQRLLEYIAEDESESSSRPAHKTDELPAHLIVRESTAPFRG